MARAPAKTLHGDVPDDLDIPVCEVVLRFGFYNIGWHHGNKRRGIRDLQNEVFCLVVDHQVQVLGLCEVFDIDDGLNEKEQVATQLVEYLNSAPSTGTLIGAACHHYVTLWRTDLGFTCAEEQSFYCRVPTRAWQKGLYLRFEKAGWPQSIHMVHNHSPSSNKRGTLTSRMRTIIAQTAWDIVCAADSAAQLVAIFGGDYNCSAVHWSAVINDMQATPSTRRRVQLCVSRGIEEEGLCHLHGDDALAINCLALQETSRYGKNFRAKEVTNTADRISQEGSKHQQRCTACLLDVDWRSLPPLCDAVANRPRLQLRRGAKFLLRGAHAKLAKRPVPEVRARRLASVEAPCHRSQPQVLALREQR